MLSTTKSHHVMRPSLNNMDVELGDSPVGYMCQTCFFTFELYTSLQKSIEDKLDEALDNLNILPVSGGMSKWMRLDSSGISPVLQMSGYNIISIIIQVLLHHTFYKKLL